MNTKNLRYLARSALQLFLLICVFQSQSAAQTVPFPVVYLSYPRNPEGGFFKTARVDETGGLEQWWRGTSLKMRRTDGRIITLIEGNQPDKGFVAIHSFGVSFDAQTIYVSILREYTEERFGDQSLFGIWADIFRLDVNSGDLVQLTNAREEWDPPRGSNNWAKTHPKSDRSADHDYWQKNIAVGTVWNTTPVPVAGNRLVFASTRRGYRSPHNRTFTAPLLYAMNAYDGKNVELIGSLSLGGAADPDVDPRTGRVVFSSGEQMGGRGNGGNGWAIWSINPDGTGFGPEVSSLPVADKNPFHFQAHTSDGSLVFTEYYDVRTYGALRVVPPHQPSEAAPTKFGPPLITDNPAYFFSFSSEWSHRQWRQLSFQPRGLFANPNTLGAQDWEMRNLSGEYVGMASHPFAIPGNGVGFTWTGNQGDAQMNLGIYMIPNVHQIVEHTNEFIRLVDLPDEHEWLAKALVPYTKIYGIDQPPLPQSPKAPDLPEGSPFGVIGTSGIWHNEIVKLDGKSLEDASINRDALVQKAEFAVIYGFNPALRYSAHVSWGAAIDSLPNGFINDNTEGYNSAINERMGTFTQLIPLKKYRTPDGGIWYGPNPPEDSTIIRRSDGLIDTSFRAIIPADYPWTIGLLTADGDSIPGSIAQTWHHVRPREERTDCGGCHAHSQPDRIPFGSTFAAKPEYASRKLTQVEFIVYERDIAPIVQRCQLPWGADVWNKSWEQLPPPAFRTTDTDIDDHPCLTPQERQTIRKWIRTGFLSSSRFSEKFGASNLILPAHGTGAYADTAHPTLNVELFTDHIAIGAVDPHTGINPSSLSVKATFKVAGRPAGTELRDLFSYNPTQYIWTLATKVPEHGEVEASIRDQQVARDGFGTIVSDIGNITKRRVTFAAAPRGILAPRNLRITASGLTDPEELSRAELDSLPPERARSEEAAPPFSWVPAWLR